MYNIFRSHGGVGGMMLDVSPALRSPGEAFPFRHEESLPPQEILGETIRFQDPVVLEGSYAMAEESLILRGTLKATVHASCAKCLEPVSCAISVPIEENFLHTDQAMLEDDGAAWEEQFSFTGSKVELNPLALTLALLALPIRFVCGAGCEGIQLPDQDNDDSQKDLPEAHPFSALQQLLTKDQEV